MATELLKPSELDRRLRYPSGRSLRLAGRGLIPCVTLPDGEVRFDSTVIDRWIRAGCPSRAEFEATNDADHMAAEPATPARHTRTKKEIESHVEE